MIKYVIYRSHACLQNIDHMYPKYPRKEREEEEEKRRKLLQ
jgi:hypothetical protein